MMTLFTLRHKALKFVSGFSLIELMVAVTLMAVVGVGVVSLMDYVNSTRVRVQTSVVLIEDVNEAELYLRTKMKTADDIVFNVDSVSTDPADFSAECLLLLQRETQDRVGLNLVNNAGTVKTSGYRGPGKGSSFALGMWFKRDNGSSDNETMARWGRWSPTDNSSFAMVINPDGKIEARVGPRNAITTNLDGLNDNRWHHLVASFDNSSFLGQFNNTSFKLYVDGYPRQMTFSHNDTLLQIDNGTSADFFELGKAFASDTTATTFSGLLANIELYASPATPVNAGSIYLANANPLGMTEGLKWDFANLSDATVTDSSVNGHDGIASNISTSMPTITSTDERFAGDVFAMVDRPNDGNDTYEMLYRPNFNGCPTSVAEAAGFSTITKDIFVRPDATTFFDNADDNSTDVLFNYGYSSGSGRTSFSFEAAPKKLTLNRKFQDEDFCLADPDLVLNPPPGVATCDIERGYAYIATDYDNSSDELFIQGAQFWSDNSTYYNIPNAPSSIIAAWNSATGVMSYTVRDNTSVPIEEWEATMRSLSYRATASDYTPQKEIVMSLGFLPMMVGSEFHFYDFVEFDTNDVVDWEVSQTEANASMFCGTAGYLATVTSEQENDFLLERFRKSTGSVPAGWLGGSDVDTPGTWVWEENSPEAGLQFWDQTNMASGDASGRPVRTDGTAVPDDSYTLTDYVKFPGTPDGSFTRRTTVSTDPNVVLAYHNMATKEPNNAGGSDTLNNEPYLQIVGSTLGNGYWNDLPDNRACMDDELYQPCGYYVEYGGRPGESLNSLVYERTIDLSVQREFCPD